MRGLRTFHLSFTRSLSKRLAGYHAEALPAAYVLLQNPFEATVLPSDNVN